MSWRFVKVLAWVEEHDRPPVGAPPGTWGGAGQPFPTPPIQMPPGGGGGSPPGTWGGAGEPMPTPPINIPGEPPGFWGPNDPRPTPPIAPGGPPPGTWGGSGQPFPEHPMAPGGPPPGTWGGAGQPFPTPPINIPGSPPGTWGGGGEGFPTPPIVIPNPPVEGHPEHPIYWPPVIWPDQPEGLPSIDPDDLPQHPELPDLNHGMWVWINDNDVLVRAFAAQVVRPSQDLPDYQPKLPPEGTQPGNWVIVMLTAQHPSWAWVPDKAPETPDGGDPPHAAHLPADTAGQLPA